MTEDAAKPAADDPLAALEREAASVDAELGGAAAPGAAAADDRTDVPERGIEENAAILRMIRAMLTPAMPFLPDCYPDEVIQNIATAYTAVEVKRGWNLAGMIGAEGALLIVSLPPTMQALALGRAHFAELRARREQAAREQYYRDRQAHETGSSPAAPASGTPSPEQSQAGGTYRVS